MEKLSSAAVVPQLLRNIIVAVVVFADESLLQISGNSKLLEKLRVFLVTCFLFFLRSLPSIVSFANPNSSVVSFANPYSSKTKKKNKILVINHCEESGIGRAIWQLLSAMNEIPVSSRKYQVVRSLAERLINDNQGENSVALLDLNRRVLNASFRTTLSRLETAVERNPNRRDIDEPVRRGLNRVVRAVVRAVGDGFIGWGGEETADQTAETSEKLAAELLWLAEKMAVYGFVDEAVEKWASASNLAWLALSCEPRLQCSLIQISALLFKEAKDIKKGSEEEEGEEAKLREIKKKMLISWIPLLCRASNGADKPVLRSAERAYLEKVLEKMISELKEEEQERVLSLWLHHYTHCASSDWPDLNGSYVRWCHSSRQLLLLG
ncbi:unnamed protein product [Arabidopsis thaliana]|jgi:hypothetical protein|uniref:1,8-cineole synthase n=3 Tax=Arabidopsis thaliana TaxID=3702 RepID=A0A654GE29_ARATH|nr:1,8-cineole synthase [Arabidopsis thaliana]AED97858.1 1,8-cineole synthase [Arabidopsis thaliana]VYS71361.1 unnamed protein product [Arabidopsis thaliana]|eukprot:NP_568987.2 1,8-cineole synthase [Arabidopsis thaliana]